MRIAVIGAGALGSAIAAELANLGREVVLLARGERLTELRDHPISVDDGDQVVKTLVEVISSFASGDFIDLAICCVKMPDLAAGLKLVENNLSPAGVVLTVQNGVEAHEAAASILPAATIAAGRIHGFFEMEDAVVRHVGVEPSLLFGCTRGDPAVAGRIISAAFAGSRISASESADIGHALWQKFMLAAALGSVAAALGIPAGQVMDTSEGSELLYQAMQEIAELAQKIGIVLTAADVAMTMDFIRAFPPDATTSLQRDFAEGRPSEFDALTGAVSRLAKREDVHLRVFPRLEATIRMRLRDRPPRSATTSGVS